MRAEPDDGRLRNLVVRHFRSGWTRSLAFALMWWVLTGGVVDSWLVGVPAVLIATVISIVLVPAFPWSTTGAAYFLPFFAWQSLRGGVDVAWRAFHPRLPITPGLIEYPLRISAGLPRIFMVNTVSLLPGTLSTELSADSLTVHALDTESNLVPELMMVEQAVARMFAVSLKNGEKVEPDGAP